MKNEFIEIRLYENTGKIVTEKINATNFHPSKIGNNYRLIDDKDDYIYTICELKNLDKTKLKLIKENLRDVEKEISLLTKKQNAYQKALNKIQNAK
jgi:hypothetical protein